MTSYEDKLKSFTQFVRTQLKDIVPQDFLENTLDEELMDAGRKNPETGIDFFSKEQERHIIMENSTNESIYEAFGNLKHMAHIEEQEKKLLEEFLAEVKPLTIAKEEKITSLLKKFEKYSDNLKVEDVDKIITIICSMFPHWILSGETCEVVEEEPLSFDMENDSVCMGCLLNDTLHQFKTFFGWAKHTHTGEILEDTEKQEEFLETYELKAKDALIDLLASLFTVRFGTTTSFLESLEKNKTFNSLFYSLCEKIWCYIMTVPLISAWVYGKDNAQKALQQSEEAKELLEGIHKQFVGKYEDCIKTKNYTPFLQDVKNYLHQFDKTQLVLLSHYGFPFQMPQRLYNSIEKLILKELKVKASEK